MISSSPHAPATIAAGGFDVHPAPSHDRQRVVARSYPAPAPLATPTDLTPAQAAAVTEVVNRLIADTIALYLKTKNYHWHLSGARFRELHLLFDEQADALLDGVDVLAERVRRLGGTTVRSVSHVAQLQHVEDDNDDFVAPAEMTARLLADNRRLAAAQRHAVDVTARHRDEATGNVLADLLDQTERRVWFLFEVGQGDPTATAG